MPEREHPLDGIADDLFDWMNQEVDYHVEAMRGGYRSPFSAELSEKDKLDYFRRQMYKTQPDGTVLYDQPNPEGRDKLLKQVGVQSYAEIIEATRPKTGRRLEPVVPPDILGPPMPEDEESV